MLVRLLLTIIEDPVEVIPDAHASYFGAEIQQDTLLPDQGARLGAVKFEDWLNRSACSPIAASW
jgi:hypothetical protein